MWLPYFPLLLAVLEICMVAGHDNYCYGKDTERTQTRHFASKTAYQIVKAANMERHLPSSACTPEKIWILHRHGTRLPSRDLIDRAPRIDQLRLEIIKNYRNRDTKPTTDALCLEDLLALQMWRWNASITADKKKFLAPQGYEDMKGTARLYQRYFPNILPNEYDSSDFLFRHTDLQRTTESFKAFTEGLFGPYNGAEAEPLDNPDLLLRPYEHCDSWKAIDFHAPETESHLFKQSEAWNCTLGDISRRLGFQEVLASHDVELLFDMCRFDQAWHVDRTSPWCGIFRPEEISVFEYQSDLVYYYWSGYGQEENLNMACGTVKDMLTHLNSKSSPKAIVSFGHSTGLQMLITALGLFRDEVPLTAENFDSMSSRRWHSSNLSPFAGNFLAVKYQCEQEMAPGDEKVMFFLNQQVVQLDWCNNGLCDWEDVMRRYREYYHADCRQFYCLGAGAAAVKVSLLTVLLIAVFTYLIR